MGKVLYEEYIPTTEELNMLRVKDECIYETYWEMMCYCRNCVNLVRVRNQGVSHKKWAEYLFKNVKESLSCICGDKSIDSDEIERRIVETGTTSYTMESN